MRSILFFVLIGCGASNPVPDLPDAAPHPDASSDTWTSWAQAFTTEYCVSCHNPTGAGNPTGDKDFTMYSVVVTWAATIRCGVAATQQSGCGSSPAPRQFPAGAPYPTDAERGRMVQWIDDGTPQ
jgi:mono/diheme cytochrome c family protein